MALKGFEILDYASKVMIGHSKNTLEDFGVGAWEENHHENNPLPGKPPERECSFCKKLKSQVRILIAAPGVEICDQCIEVCNEIIAELEVF